MKIRKRLKYYIDMGLFYSDKVMMQKFGRSLKIIGLLLGIFVVSGCVYLYMANESVGKLTVDEILKEHLETRFDDEAKASELTLLLRKRILNPANKGRLILYPHFRFLPLEDEDIPVNSSISDTIVYTDFHIRNAAKDVSPYKIAWLLESPKPHGKGIKFLSKKRNQGVFNRVCTCYRPLLERGAPYVYTPVEGTSADPNIDLDEVIQNKDKMVSIIASDKNWCPGHKLRHKTVERFEDKIDSIVGRGYKPIPTTSDGLLNVYYSVVIENRKQDFYFSEKIIDCILCGTVPIYWGCPSIGKFFNEAGIIQFDTLDELEGILANISEKDYNKRLDAMRENFNTAKCYLYKDKYLLRELRKIHLMVDKQKP